MTTSQEKNKFLVGGFQASDAIPVVESEAG